MNATVPPNTQSPPPPDTNKVPAGIKGLVLQCHHEGCQWRELNEWVARLQKENAELRLTLLHVHNISAAK